MCAAEGQLAYMSAIALSQGEVADESELSIMSIEVEGGSGM
jgi:hypothetical protein